MITHNGISHSGEYYTWELVYKISGLCQDDFTYDSTGSWEYFIQCLERWEDKAWKKNDLRIYSLSEEQIQSKLESYEDKIINLWEIFCD